MFWDLMKFLAAILGGAAAVVGLCVVIVGSLDQAQCNQRSARMGVEHEWGLIEGCMVKLDDQWQPFNDYVTARINRGPR